MDAPSGLRQRTKEVTRLVAATCLTCLRVAFLHHLTHPDRSLSAVLGRAITRVGEVAGPTQDRSRR
jgi:hypothetical protein